MIITVFYLCVYCMGKRDDVEGAALKFGLRTAHFVLEEFWANKGGTVHF